MFYHYIFVNVKNTTPILHSELCTIHRRKRVQSLSAVGVRAVHKPFAGKNCI